MNYHVTYRRDDFRCTQSLIEIDDLSKEIGSNRKLLILDRDGVIIKDNNYVCSFDKVELLTKNIEIFKRFQEHGWSLAVATNQSAVARGFISEQDMLEFNCELLSYIQINFHLTISTFLYCPNHPEFSRNCRCRKPNPGMLLSLMKIYGITRSNCLFIGDQTTDKEAAQRSGVSFFYPSELAANANELLNSVEEQL